VAGLVTKRPDQRVEMVTEDVSSKLLRSLKHYPVLTMPGPPTFGEWRDDRSLRSELLRVQIDVARRNLASLEEKDDRSLERAAEEHLGVSRRDMAVFGGPLPTDEPMRSKLALRRVALDAERFGAKAGGANPGSAPEFLPTRFGRTEVALPTSAAYYFGSGTLAAGPLIVRVFRFANQPGGPTHLSVWSPATSAAEAERYRFELVEKAYDVENPFRGTTLSAKFYRTLDFEVVNDFRASRTDLILPPTIWDDIDENVGGFFAKVDRLEGSNLTANRGVLLAGPPGVGKTALCRVLAAELSGQVTVVVCRASVAQHWLHLLYREVGHLTPALVLLEDLDLIIGDRDLPSTNISALGEFLTVLDGLMTEHSGVVTIATTNDPAPIDRAAQRSSRFDRIVDFPLPDAVARSRILQVYLRSVHFVGDLDRIVDVTEGATGADLRDLVTRAALRHSDLVRSEDLIKLVGDQRFTGGHDGTATHVL